MAPYRLSDGTPVFHPVGMLPVDRDEDRIRCGLCGKWVRGLATHVRLAHDWSADDYRAEFGLNAQRPLQAPGVSEAQAARLKRRLKTDRRLQAALRQGQALARSGELNAMGRQADAEHGRAYERQRRTEEQGRRIGELRAARFRAQRDRRAQELGFADAEALLRQRYIVDEAPVAELAATLGCAAITVSSELNRLGIPRRLQRERRRWAATWTTACTGGAGVSATSPTSWARRSAGCERSCLALGREVLAEQRRACRASFEARARGLGFPRARPAPGARGSARRSSGPGRLSAPAHGRRRAGACRPPQGAR